MIKKIFLIIVIITFNNVARAATECYFTNFSAISINTVTTTGPITLKNAGGWYSTPFDTGIIKKTDCNTGRAGDDLNGWYTVSPALAVPSPDGGYYVALYETTVPGIYYSVKIKSTTPPVGYLPATATRSEVYDVSDKDEKNYLDNGVVQNFYIVLYQSTNFVAGADQVRPKTTGTIGYFQYGTASGQGVAVQINNFSIPLVVPTCNASLSTQNASGSTVKLGDYAVDDIVNNKTKPITFSFNLSNCTNVSKANIRLTSANYDSNTGYLTNDNGVNLGVGVKLTDGNHISFKPNTTQTENLTNSSGSNTLYYTAQLLKLGNVTPGTFEAMSIFEITYN